MTVRRIKGSWYVDCYCDHPITGRKRIRRRSPVQTKRGAQEYERQLIHAVLLNNAVKRRREVPTLRAFQEEFMTNYAEANNKPSVLRSKRSIFKHHLVPAFGRLRLDAIC